MLSIIIPSYNDAETLKENLPGFTNYLHLKNIELEIILVDDGSKDVRESEKIAKEYGCTFLALPHHKGKGAAVRAGILHAKGQYKLFTDADIPFEYEAVEHFLQYLQFKEFDIVVGDRTLSESNYFQDIPFLRKISSSLFTFIVGRFITTGLLDTQCGIKGFRADVANDLFSVSTIKGFAFDVEILYIALKRNYDIKRLPVRLRKKGNPGFQLLKHAPSMMWDILLLKVRHWRGTYNKLKQ